MTPKYRVLHIGLDIACPPEIVKDGTKLLRELIAHNFKCGALVIDQEIVTQPEDITKFYVGEAPTHRGKKIPLVRVKKSTEAIE